MSHTPVALLALLARYNKEQRQINSAEYSIERLCREYIEPLLVILGWDVANQAGVRDNKKPVEMLLLPGATAGCRVYAYLLHEQSYRYWRHYLVGVALPPLKKHTSELLSALEHTLRRSSVLIETLALTDFSQICFYDNTPGADALGGPQRGRLYSLPHRHYQAWWGELHGLERLGFNARSFDLYAAKLKNWSGLGQDPDNLGDAAGRLDQ